MVFGGESGMKHIVLVITIIVSGLSGTLSADSFTERPWGLDSVAGRCVVCHSMVKGGPRSELHVDLF
jgi:hypothetical protein